MKSKKKQKSGGPIDYTTIQIMGSWKNAKEINPKHKDLVMVKNNHDEILPAIYYNNKNFKGFYRFTTYYHNYKDETYESVIMQKIENVRSWINWPK